MKIKSLSLHNFKGQKQQTVQFSDVTNIYGKNGTGKTSIGDAINYAFFGKDMNDKKTFSIQTLDKENNRIDHLETEVAMTVEHNHQTFELKRVYKQKWTKIKGTPEPVFTGYEEDLFINEVPVKLSDYKMRIDSFIKEDIFKMTTNPEYFNGIPWIDRRNTLMRVAGPVDDYAIAGTNQDFIALLNKLRGQNKSMLDYKKEILSKKKTIKEELETLPTRIDEADRSKPEVQDWKELESKIKENQALINGIEDLISDKVKADSEKNKEILDWNQKILDAERHLQRLESALKVDYEKEDQEIENKIIDLKKAGNRIAVKRNEGNSDINKVENSIKENNSTIQSIIKLQSDLRTEFSKENAKSFEMPEGECKCPTCQREFDEEVLLGKREELEANFNTNKAEKLASIKAKGISLGSQIEELEKENAEAENQLTFLREAVALDAQDIELKKTEIDDLESGKSKEKQPFESFRDADPEYSNQVIIVSQFKTGTPKKSDSDNSQIDQYKIQRSEFQFKIDTIKIQLQDKAIIERTDKRIQELKDQEKTQVAKLNELEKDEFLIQQFTKAKITTIENTVNTHFQIVKWKMFRQLINGGEEECCEATVNGVPYQDVNTAGKINAGLDIINALSRYFNVDAPIIIDNRESTSEIIETESQIINLIVSPADKKLRIESEVAELATV